MSELSRRELLAAGAAIGAAAALGEADRVAAGGGARIVRRIDFQGQADAEGWGSQWRSVGVANLRRAGGEGLLEAGSDVFPNDPRPVAFAVDARLRDVEVEASITRPGLASGVVVRRRGPGAYYCAVYDSERGSLRILRRFGVDLDELAAVPAPAVQEPLTLTLTAAGAHPTTLRAALADATGRSFATAAEDATKRLQRAGDAGVLATADTLFPSERDPVVPSLGNLHLLPWGVQEGQAFMNTALGQEVVAEIRRRSTAGFRAIEVRSAARPRPTKASIVAATTGVPLAGGARLLVATDVEARVELELSYSSRFDRSWTVPVGRTGPFHASARAVRGLKEGRRVYWRARARRRGLESKGPVRSFTVLPQQPSDQRLRVAVASCAAQFGPTFEHLARRRPHAFVWLGDLNYPDTHGPLAQTMSCYAGIWRDFLANPLLGPVLARTAFAPQRDDHDYGTQDANSTNVERYPWVLAPWGALMNRRLHYRFRAGAAELWVLDQRRHKSDPALPDTPDKTLLGTAQRRWLLRTLAASDARFKVICSPTTVFMAANARDGNWGSGFTAERDLILEHVRRRVSGTTIFLTGDTHLTGVLDAPGRFEARAAPLGIPTPNDVTLVDPLAASRLGGQPDIAYADDRNHFTLLEVRGRGSEATLDLRLVREDGATPYERSFRQGS